MLQTITYKFRAQTKGMPAREPLIVQQDIPQLNELDMTNPTIVGFLNQAILDISTAFYKEAVTAAGGSVDNVSILEIINDYMSDGRSGVDASRFAAFADALKAFLLSKGKSGPSVSQLIAATKKRLKEAAFVKESTLNSWENVIVRFSQVDGVLDEFSDVLEVLSANIQKARTAQTSDDLDIE